MLVAIDLAHNHTHLRCWSAHSNIDKPIINVMMPGWTGFNPGSGSSGWNPSKIKDCLAHLQHEYILPSRLLVESVALAVPGILPLNHRAGLLGMIEELWGLDEALVLPRPLALAAGYNLSWGDPGLQGDVLLVEVGETVLDYAMFCISSPGGIILETQFSSARTPTGPGLAGLDQWDEADWDLDSVLVTGEPISDDELADYLAALPGRKAVITRADPDDWIMAGLFCTWSSASPDPAARLNFIYPFEFWLCSDLGPDFAPLRHKIPFDTANLELAYNGRYALIDLAADGFEQLPDFSVRLNLSIFELPAGTNPGHDFVWDTSFRVLEIDSLRSNLPPQLIVLLDMAKSNLQIDLALPDLSASAPAADAMRLRLAATQERLMQKLGENVGNESLLQAWSAVQSSPQPASQGLATQVHNCLFKLHALNILWLEK